jgi:hypothetical protein
MYADASIGDGGRKFSFFLQPTAAAAIFWYFFKHFSVSRNFEAENGKIII